MRNGLSSAIGAFLAFGTSSEIPIPAALPLFASSVGMLGFLGWRRKKKTASKCGVKACWGRFMKLHALLFASVIGLASAVTPASANFVFSGSGTSGNFTGQAGEPWSLNFSGPPDNWGSPGVGAGTTPYLEGVSAFGMDVTFFGVSPIDPAQIIVGNGAACVGAGGGGTTFCNAPFGTAGIWQAFQTGPDSISFRAQDVSQILDPNELFFVNVFFLPSTAAPTDFRFEGAWLTEFSPNPTPLPAALPLFATGLGALGLLGWRRKKKAGAAMAA